METYVLRVENPPAGAAGAQITLVHWSAPGGPAEMARDLSPMSLGPFTVKGMRDKVTFGQPADPDLPAVGQQLYSMLAVGQVAAPLDTLIKTGEGRVVLDVRPAAWQDLPWELARQGNRKLFARPQRPWSRGLMNPGLPPPVLEWPLRILIVIGSRPGDSQVKAEEEVRAILSALEKAEDHVDVLIERQPGRDRLLALLRASGPRPHIFHYIGHGGVQEPAAGVPAGDAWLQIVNCPTPDCAGASVQDWAASEIFQVFDTGHKPNLVVLNACRSATFAQHGLNSLSSTLIDAGVHAVLGMRAEVGPDDAIKFSAAFYTALASGDPLDVAVAAARNEIFGTTPHADSRPEWAAPVLQVCGDAGDLIALPAAPQPAVPVSREFDKLRLTVDRRPDRFNAWQKVHARQRHVFALVGPPEIGKTWFSKIVMARCRLAGWQVRYIDLSQEAAILPLQVLERIVDGDGSDTPLTRPLQPADLFDPFRQQLAADRPTAEQPGIDTVKDKAFREIFVKFHDGLTQYAALHPLIIVIDFKALAQVDNERWHFERVLVPRLFSWVAERQEHDILLVLVVRSDDYAWLLERGLALAEECSVRGFPANQWEELAWEWVRRNATPPANALQAEQILRAAIEFEGLNSIREGWKPEDFDVLRLRAKQAGYDVRK